MSWLLGRAPGVGDWIKTTETVPVSLTDALTGSGVPAGTRGVITKVSGFFGGHLVARFDGGLLGSVTAQVRPSHVRVIRRGAGIEAFNRSVGRRNQVRLGAALALLGPLLYFCSTYMLRGGTKEGLIVELMNSAIYGAQEMLEYVVTNPAQGLLYCALVWGVGRLAFGRW